MTNEPKKEVKIPSLAEIQSERKRIRREAYYRQALRDTVAVLVVVAAVAVLIATLFLPILQISGDSMSPTLEHDEIVVLVKTKERAEKYAAEIDEEAVGRIKGTGAKKDDAIKTIYA